MKCSIVFKFLAIALCALMLLGAVGSAIGIIGMTELGLYDRTVAEVREQYLRSDGSSLAGVIVRNYADVELGGWPEELAEPSVYELGVQGRDGWFYGVFNPAATGYVLKDADGNVLESGGADSLENAVTYEFPISGTYKYVLSVTPVPEAEMMEETENTEIVGTIPEGGADVYSMSIAYEDGSESVGSGDPIGYIWSSDGAVRFEASVSGLLEPPAVPVTTVTFRDEYDNILFQESSDNVGYFSVNEEGFLTFDTAPELISAQTQRNAVPAEGADVYSMLVSYQNEAGLENSSKVSALTPIGRLFYDEDGTLLFHASVYYLLNVPGDAPVTSVEFRGAYDNVLYQASSSEGVGTFGSGEIGMLTFRTHASEAGLDSAAEETPAPETVSPAIYDGLPSEGAEIYAATFSYQSEAAGEGSMSRYWVEPVGVLTRNDAGVLFFLAESAFYQDNFPEDTVITAVEFRGEGDTLLYREENPAGVGEFIWGADGTATTFRVTPAAEERLMPEQTQPNETAAAGITPAETETIPGETDPAETLPAETEPEQTVADPVPSTDSIGVSFTDDRVHTASYWDPDTQQTMAVEYRYAQMPAYTLELTVAPGAYRYDAQYALLEQVWTYRNDLFLLLGASLLLFAILAVYLCCAAGRKPGSDEVHAAGFNCIPLDAYLACGGLLVVGFGALIVEYGDDLIRQSIQTACAGVLGAGYLMSLIFVGFCFACAAQFKTPGGYWWRNSICWRCLNLLVRCVHGFIRMCIWLFRKLPGIFTVLWGWVLAVLHLVKRMVLWLWGLVKHAAVKAGKTVNSVYSMMPLTWQWLLTGFTMVVLLFVSFAARSEFMVVLSLCACVAVVLYGAYCFGTLLESARRMSKGDLDTKVDDKLLTGAFQDFAGNLNDLAGVAVVAAQKQLKSERMKTELITNVSHDIKTPLTSIINYVDLLQKPHTAEEEKTYLEVLDRQSQRLKKLIDDLMEMSKASTGNLTVDITRLDAAEAVNQALGEFADKLDRAQLTPVFRRPEEPVAMMADGRLTWRVLSNLLSNAVKYALPGTRLYLDLMALEGKVIISLKNISRDELNVDADELMERFVRGDDSRNTEGSGLGLNIAKTLMELQKGQLQLLVDGDLFKVTLIFPGA
ncbi:MAG: sensor histidine kinase [Faecousia sp.]